MPASDESRDIDPRVDERAGATTSSSGKPGQPRAGPKPGLTLERIARAAIRIADRDGLAAVSMQRVSQSFGYTTMSIYRYVPGKRGLLELMIDTAIGDPPTLATVPGGWRAKLQTWAACARSGFQAHPWLIQALATDRVLGPNELRWLEVAVTALAPTRLAGGELPDAVALIAGHVRISAQHTANRFRQSDPDTAREQWKTATVNSLGQHTDRYPNLNAAIDQGALHPGDDNQFEFGLGLILDGIAARSAARTPLPSP
jgi:AcrR family transcriptional regulator